MKCQNCSAEVVVQNERDQFAVCPSCGSPLAPNISVRFNPEALAASAAGAEIAHAASKRRGRAVLWLMLLIVVAIVVAYFFLHH